MLNFITKIKNLEKSYNKEDYGYLCFSLDLSDENRYLLLKNGWWHIYYFASTYKTDYGMRITPNMNYKDWPVMSTFDFESTTTLAPNLSLLFYFKYLTLIEDQELFEEYNRLKDKIHTIAKPFLEVVNGIEELKYFEQYFTNNSNLPNSEEKILENYLHFWNRYDNSYGHKILRTIITEFMKDNNTYYDEIEYENLGIWKSRILYILVQRVCNLELNLKNNLKIEKLLWELFSCLNVYDSEDINLSHFSNEISTPKSELWYCINELGIDIDKRSDYLKKGPLFPALLKMSELYLTNFNLNKYIGIEHMEAAAYYDSELNDPIMAWNCLVCAAYWSGVNTNETLLPAWEAAIYLAEKHGWKDVHVALTDQYTFYNNYKMKNNIT